MVLIGTPENVVDTMQEWFESKACDGFNLIPALFPDEFEAFVKMVVPELQSRKIFRTEYEGNTLRQLLGIRQP